MVFGGPDKERLQLNEESIWTGTPGKPEDYHCEGPGALPEIRRLTFENKWSEAQDLFGSTMVRNRWFSKYQPMCDLWLEFPGHEQPSRYQRELALDTAISTVTYQVAGVAYRREAFISPVDQVLVVVLTADRPGKLTFGARLAGTLDYGKEYAGSGAEFSPEDAAKAKVIGTIRTEAGAPGEIVLRGKVEHGVITYQARLRVLPTGGARVRDGDRIRVQGADSALLLLAAATNFRNFQDVSGDPEGAVKANTAMTRRLRSSGRTVAVTILDHSLASSANLSVFNGVLSHPGTPPRINLRLSGCLRLPRPKIHAGSLRNSSGRTARAFHARL